MNTIDTVNAVLINAGIACIVLFILFCLAEVKSCSDIRKKNAIKEQEECRQDIKRGVDTDFREKNWFILPDEIKKLRAVGFEQYVPPEAWDWQIKESMLKEDMVVIRNEPEHGNSFVLFDEGDMLIVDVL
ncbi:MAG TPA: hypothetical protein DCL21_06855 [Alphaproteobacteria bacterium]|nr:hypothetical protein [Alphaproteobacteria bacterium]